MLVINFKGITPQQRFYSHAVKGNNNANEIKFIVERYQNDLDLASLTPYLKVSSKCENYFDKIALTLTSDDDFVYLVWTMTSKSTQYRNLELQLQFQSAEVVFQTQIIELELNNTINADIEIEEEYPSELQRLNKEVKEVKEDVDDLDSEVKTKVSKTSEANKVYGTDENGNQTLYPKDSFGQVEDVKVNGESVVTEKTANIDLTPYAKKIGELPSITITSNTTIEDLFNEYPNLDNTLFTLKINGLNVAKRFIVIIHKYNVIANITFYYFKILEMSYINNNFNYYEHNSVSGVPQNKKISELVSSTYKHTIADKSYVEDLLSGIDARIGNIEELIPAQASEENKLADKDFVNSSIATNTAYFKGTFNVVTELGLTIEATHEQIATALASAVSDPTNNDYVFVSFPDPIVPSEYTKFSRYKYNGETETWAFEFDLNNSSFTAQQWASINSGITSQKVSNYDSHLADKNNPHEVSKSQVGLGNVDNTSDADKPVSTAQATALGLKANESVISDQYDSTRTYAVGDIVIYNNVLYKCITAITTPEAWDSSHWTATTVKAEMVNVSQEQIIEGKKIFSNTPITKGFTFVNNVANPNDRTKLTIKNDNGYNAKILFSDYGFIFTANMVGSAIAGTNFGSTTYYFGTMFAQNISDKDNNQVSTKDIKALIDYAKAQGWIS